MQIIPGFADKASGWLAGPILGTGIDGSLSLGSDTTLAAGANVRHYTDAALGIFTLTHAAADNYIEARATGEIVGDDVTLAKISGMSRGNGGTNAGGAACADSGTGAQSAAGGAGASAVRVYARLFQSFRITAKGGDAAPSSSGVNNGVNPDGASGNQGTSDIAYRNATDTNGNPRQASGGGAGLNAGVNGAGGTGAGATANATLLANVKNAFRPLLHEFLWGPNAPADGAATDTRAWRSSSGGSGGSGSSKNTNGGTVYAGGGGGGGMGASGAKGASGTQGTSSSTAVGTAVVACTGGSGGGGGGAAAGVAERAVNTVVDARGGNGAAYADPDPLIAGGTGGTGGAGGGGVAYGGTKSGSGLTVLADGGDGGTPGSNDGEDGIAVQLTLGAL